MPATRPMHFGRLCAICRARYIEMANTGFFLQGTDIGNIYGAKGATKVADCGFRYQGTDLSNILLAIGDGKALGFNTNYQQGGSDLSSKFGIPTGNTPLPINGQTFSASANSGTASCSASMTFAVNNSSWTMSGSG